MDKIEKEVRKEFKYPMSIGGTLFYTNKNRTQWFTPEHLDNYIYNLQKLKV